MNPHKSIINLYAALLLYRHPRWRCLLQYPVRTWSTQDALRAVCCMPHSIAKFAILPLFTNLTCVRSLPFLSTHVRKNDLLFILNASRDGTKETGEACPGEGQDDYPSITSQTVPICEEACRPDFEDHKIQSRKEKDRPSGCNEEVAHQAGNESRNCSNKINHPSNP